MLEHVKEELILLVNTFKGHRCAVLGYVVADPEELIGRKELLIAGRVDVVEHSIHILGLNEIFG